MNMQEVTIVSSLLLHTDTTLHTTSLRAKEMHLLNYVLNVTDTGQKPERSCTRDETAALISLHVRILTCLVSFWIPPNGGRRN